MLKVKTPKTGKAKRELQKRAPKFVSCLILYFSHWISICLENYCRIKDPEDQFFFFLEMTCLFYSIFGHAEAIRKRNHLFKSSIIFFFFFGYSTFGLHVFVLLQVESGKKTLILHGTKTSNVLNSVLTQIYHLKKDSAVKYSRKNADIRPFESGGETSLEFFSLKTDCSMFVVST